jgi:DnaJ-domain-containing protein 1
LDILKDFYKPTDYFNEAKYHVPRQCEKTSEIISMKAQYEAYKNMIRRVKKEFDDIEQEEMQLGQEAMMKKTKDLHSQLRSVPFVELGAAVLLEIEKELQDKGEKLGRAQNIYHKTIADLYAAYHKAYSDAESCGERLAIGDRYMEMMAIATRDYQRIWLPVFRDYFNDRMYWGQMASPDKHLQRAAYAAAVSSVIR